MTDSIQAGRYSSWSGRRKRWLRAVALIMLLGGISWLIYASPRQAPSAADGPPSPTAPLQNDAVVSMDNPAFVYSPGWHVDAGGADPAEPDAPWDEPSGDIRFQYTGQELSLNLAVGNYWGYLYVTVDGEPANLLPLIVGNPNSRGDDAGYRTFLEPDQQTDAGPTASWVRVHRASDDQKHDVRIEVWRSWGQTPLRGVAIDHGLTARPTPLWPGVLLVVVALWLTILAWSPRGGHFLEAGWWGDGRGKTSPANEDRPAGSRTYDLPVYSRWARLVSVAACAALLVVAAGAWLSLWWLCLVGVGLLAAISIVRPAWWLAALLFALPFYYAVPLPLLPNRAFSIIDLGILGGMAIFIAHLVLFGWQGPIDAQRDARSARWRWGPLLVLAAILSWALVSVFAAQHTDVALHEWRVVFLYAGLFALLLMVMLNGRNAVQDRNLLVSAWLAGATVVALIGLGQYVTGKMVIEAEEVTRVRGLYGSPNNLAIYLERTLAVALALAVFSRAGRWRLVWGAMAAIQIVTLILTFSKGGIVLALPVIFAALGLGGAWLLRRRRESLRPLLWLLVAALLAFIVLAPFLSAERFQQLANVNQGTGFLRLQLWRSAWHMALDHMALGVGPDNFLYAFRSHYILPAAWQEPNLNHPHNWILDWWTRLGLPGLVLGCAFFGFGMWVLWRRMGRGAATQPVGAALNLGLLAAALAALAHGLIDVSFALPDLMLVWVLLFVLTAEDASK